MEGYLLQSYVRPLREELARLFLDRDVLHLMVSDAGIPTNRLSWEGPLESVIQGVLDLALNLPLHALQDLLLEVLSRVPVISAPTVAAVISQLRHLKVQDHLENWEQRQLIKRLREELVVQLDDVSILQLLASDAGFQTSRTAWNGSPEIVIARLLQECDRQGEDLFHRFLTEVRDRYSGAFLPETKYFLQSGGGVRTVPIPIAQGIGLTRSNHPPRVYISYRRSDSPGHAGRLADGLIQALGSNRVFFDVDSIPVGDQFALKIDAELRASDVLVVVIGPGWLYSHSDDFYVRQWRTDD